MLDYFVNPFVGGVYAGRPIAAQRCPCLSEAVPFGTKYGSLIAGTLLGARERARSADKSKLKARMFTFDDGLQVLINALHEAVKDSVQLGRPVLAVGESGNRWRLRLQDAPESEHAAVLFCAPAHQLAHILIEQNTN